MPKKPQIDIDTSKIPEHVRLELLSIAYDATIEYFKQPGVEEKFQRWKAAKEASAKKRQLLPRHSERVLKSDKKQRTVQSFPDRPFSGSYPRWLRYSYPTSHHCAKQEPGGRRSLLPVWRTEIKMLEYLRRNLYFSKKQHRLHETVDLTCVTHIE